MWVCEACGLTMPDGLGVCMGCGTPRSEAEPSAPAASAGAAASAGSGAGTAPCTGASRPLRRSFTPPTTTAEAQATPVADAATCDSCGNTVLVLRPGWTRELPPIRIDAPICILGREGDYSPEIFSGKVGRQQVELAFSDGTWKVTQVGTTNPSWIITREGSVKLAVGMEYVLHGGERLRLADQTFIVSIEEVAPAEPTEGAPTPQEAAPAEDRREDESLVEGWFVYCKHCDTTFRVGGPDDKRACTVCVDSQKRKLLRRVTPVFESLAQGTFVDVR